MDSPLHAGARPRTFVTHFLGIAVLFVLLVALGATGGLWVRLISRLTSIDVTVTDQSGNQVELPADLSAGQPLDILIIGSDDRSGSNASIGGHEDGARGDVTILVHVSADRSQVKMASIPRDLMVTIPSCSSTGTEDSDPVFAQFNTAYSTGLGPEGDVASAVSCVMSTVSRETGIVPDAAVVMDFTAVVGVVDALGGVQICGENAFEPESVGDFRLDEGCHLLNGAQAIQYLRARHVAGTDGSDLARIARQQCFMRQAARQALAGDLLSKAPVLYSVAEVVADNTTLTDNLASTPALVGFLHSLASMPAGGVHSASPPLSDWEEDPNRVVWGPNAATFWREFSRDEVPTPPTDEAPTPSQSAADTPDEQTHTPAPSDAANEAPTDAPPSPTPTPEDPAPLVEYCH